MLTRNRKSLAVTNAKLQSEVLFFPRIKIPIPEHSAAYLPGGNMKLDWKGMGVTKVATPHEQMAVIKVKAEAARYLTEIQMFGAGQAPAGNKKECLVKDLVIGKYHNLVGEVVKMYWPDDASLDLYVTDYTENKDLYLYLDPNDDDGFNMPTQTRWPGPYGQVTIAIRLWEPHASWVRANIRVGEIVYLQNVHAKLSQENKLEGVIHQDHKYRDKICVHKCNRASQIAALNQRKAAHEQEYQMRQEARSAPQNLPKKPSAKASAKKKEKQRQRREQEKVEHKRAAAEEIAQADINPHGKSSVDQSHKISCL